MIHPHDAIRRHLERGRNLDRYVPRSPQEKELIEQVYDLARNRMEMGSYRYGRLQDRVLRGYVDGIDARLAEYRRTHNTELLVDVINLAMIECLYPTFNDAVFEPIDDGIHCANAKE